MTRIAVALVVLAAAAWMQPVAGPELAIVNARVFTGDASRPWAEAVAVKANRIVVVGTTAEARAAASATTRVIDAGGRLLIPGINDAHVHPGATPPATSLEGPPAMEHDPTLDEVLKRLEAAVAKAPSGGWIEGEIGGGVLADPAATRATLDRVSAGHPVYLHAWTGHGVIVNTAALRALKIRDDEPDPPGGRFARADDGRTISGLAEEYACYLVARRLSLLTDSAERARGFAGFASEAASLGITSAQAMATSFPLDATLEALRGGDLPLRLRLIDFPFTPMSQWTAAPALGRGVAARQRVRHQVDPRRHTARAADVRAPAVQRSAVGPRPRQLPGRRPARVPHAGACGASAADVPCRRGRGDRRRARRARSDRRRQVETAAAANRAWRHARRRRIRARHPHGRDAGPEPVALHDPAGDAGSPRSSTAAAACSRSRTRSRRACRSRWAPTDR